MSVVLRMCQHAPMRLLPLRVVCDCIYEDVTM